MGRKHTQPLTWGYSLPDYYRLGIHYPVKRPLFSHCHALITGASGSGKSLTVLWLLGRLLQVYPELRLTFCDFKNSEEFRFLEPFSGYYSGTRCLDGFLEYSRQFSSIRENGTNQVPHLLLCDEYQAMVNYFQAVDRREKSKQAAEILSIAAEILMLGRGLNCFLWTVTQRCSAELFNQGSRDNFQIVLALGNLSKEQRNMLFSGEELPPGQIYRPGEGLLLSDGYPLTEVKFPLISDVKDWQEHILRILCRPADA